MAQEKSKREIAIIPAYEPTKSFSEHASKLPQTATQLIAVIDGSGERFQSVFDEEEPKGFYGGFARFGRWLFRTFSPRYEACVTQQREPVVYVCRHLNMHGPFTTLKWLPFHVHPMILHVYFDKEKTVKHMTEYTFSARYGKQPKKFSLAAHVMSWIAPPMMASLQGIPVYRNGISSISTLKAGLKYLLQAESLIVYPDIDYTGNYSKPSDIYDGFLMLGDMYRKKTGKDLRFVPLVIDDERRCILEGNAICVSDFRHECAGAADYLKRAINKEGIHTLRCMRNGQRDTARERGT